MKRNFILIAMLLALVLMVGCGASGETDEELAYRDFMSETSEDLSTYLTDTSRALDTFDYNDPAWITKMATALNGIENTANRVLDNKEVPKKFEKADIEYKEAMWHYLASVEYLVIGIDEDSSTHIKKATAEMEKATDRISAATSLLK